MRDRELGRMLRYMLAALLVMAVYAGAQVLGGGPAAQWVIVGFMLAVAYAAHRECRRADRTRDDAEEDRRLSVPLPEVDRAEVFDVYDPVTWPSGTTAGDLAEELIDRRHGIEWPAAATCPECGVSHDDDDRHAEAIETEAREAVDMAPFRDLLDRWDADIRSMRERWLDDVAVAS